MLNQKRDFNPIFWIHLILVILIVASPFLFSLALIAVGAMVLWLQYLVFGGCILTFQQFGRGDSDMTFWYYLLTKLGLNVDKRKVKLVVRYALPFVIVGVAFIWQFELNNDPLLF